MVYDVIKENKEKGNDWVESYRDGMYCMMKDRNYRGYRKIENGVKMRVIGKKGEDGWLRRKWLRKKRRKKEDKKRSNCGGDKSGDNGGRRDGSESKRGDGRDYSYEEDNGRENV